MLVHQSCESQVSIHNYFWRGMQNTIRLWFRWQIGDKNSLSFRANKYFSNFNFPFEIHINKNIDVIEAMRSGCDEANYRSWVNIFYKQKMKKRPIETRDWSDE